METSNQKKNRLLGMPYGTATSKLRKMLMFEMAKRLDEDTCFRCGTKIDNIDDFSIERTEAWQGSQNPYETFFDTTKIAYSHLSCNTAAGTHPHKKYANKTEAYREASRRRYADPPRYVRHLERKRKAYKDIK